MMKGGKDILRMELVERCIKDITSKLFYNEPLQEAFKIPIYIYDLSEEEKRMVDKYFK